MIHHRRRRFMTVLLGATLAAALAGPALVVAKNPTWDITFVQIPHTVAPGNDAGWEVTIWNNGTSTINDLTATFTALDTPTALPTYSSDLQYSSGGPGSCDTASGLFVCSIGTLVAGAYVSIVVAYAVPADQTGTFDLNVAIAAGTGNTGSDGPGKSRGDAFDKTSSTAVSHDPNFDGGFVPEGGDTYQTNPDITNRNIQSTALSGSAELIGVTIEDGITRDPDCNSTTPDPACANLFGEWSAVHVGDGSPYATAFKVTLVVRGSAVPGGLSPEDIVVVHVLDDGSVDVIGDDSSERCLSATTAPAAPPDCIYVEKVGSNWQIVVWMFQNGTLRGGW